MNLLSQAVPQIRQFLRRPRVFSAVVFGSLLGLEILGRTLSSDIYDTLASSALLVLVSIVLVYHRDTPLGWVNWLGRGAQRVIDFFDRFRIEVGIDLRGQPPIPRRTPVSMWWTLGWFLLVAGLGLTLWLCFPEGWRAILIQGSYIGYLLVVTALWSMLFVCFVGCIYLPIMLWSHLAPRSFYRADAPRMSKIRSLIIVLLYVTLMGLSYATLPLWIILILCGVSMAILLLCRLHQSRSEVAMIWRPRGSRKVFSVPSFRLAINFLTLWMAFCVAMILLASGGQVFESNEAEKTMTMTVFLGGLFAWTLPGMLIVVGMTMYLFWLRNPSRPAPSVVHVAGYFAPENRSRLVRAFRQRGWTLRFDPTPPARTDIRIHLVESEKSQAKEFDPSWPLHVSLEDLEEGTVFARFERRNELLRRHLFYRGIKAIYRSIRGQEFQQGAGFWLAPHLWFQPSMTRDDDGEDRDGSGLMQAVGPPYREVFDRAVRNHLFQVLRSVEIDIIFVEDGIRSKSIRRVFRRIFEFFDKSRGKRRIEEVNFQGLPKIRVMMHDLQLDMPFESSRYPEPKYDVIGRARVLHIFKDRGDQEDLLDLPGDFSWSPAPLKLE
jgi:hypothetical protein